MIFIKIAWTNLLRNSRRTISTLLSILIGVSVIVFINGFNDGISASWANAIINSARGHFILRHQHYTEYSSSDMESILIPDPGALKTELQQNPHIIAAAERVVIGGLAGQEEKSTSFFGAAFKMDELYTVLPNFSDNIVEGVGLKAGDPMGAVLGKALAESLNVKVGDELVILGNSIYAEQNAILIYIRGLLRVPARIEIEQSLILTDIEQVQERLLDIGMGATEILVRIDDIANLEEVVRWVNNHFREKKEPWMAFPWYEDKRFQQGMGLFEGIGNLIAIVVSLLVGIVISNALLMSIFERIREIGTLRAVGTEKAHIYRIFYAEAIITTLIGIVFGMILGSLITVVVGAIGITVPGLAEGQPIYPLLKFINVLISGAIPIIVTGIAVLFPIRSSCRMDIVEALNYR